MPGWGLFSVCQGTDKGVQLALLLLSQNMAHNIMTSTLSNQFKKSLNSKKAGEWFGQEAYLRRYPKQIQLWAFIDLL